MRLGSIRARLLAWSAVLTFGALLFAWLALSGLLHDFVARRLEAELAATARGILAASTWDDTGTFTVSPAPADPRFERPVSGWYWQVTGADGVLARSESLLGGQVEASGGAHLGPDGAALIAWTEDYTAPGDAGRLTVTVTLPAAEAAAELAAVRRPLAVSLATLAVALLLAQGLAVSTGLSDLTRFARGVAALRDGRAETLPDARSAELQPLAEELARLVAAKTAQLDRARAAAADLAHALKTPLAVLANRAGPEDAELIARMNRILDWHLRRARAAGAGLNPAARTDVTAVLADLGLVLGPEARRRGVAIETAAEGAPHFRGDAEDLAEILSALAENAVKWARSRVRISARACPEGLEIAIADDGPGIPAPERDRLLARGARLDEGTPGHGLGLAIAADRIRAYRGRLVLDEAETGGLRVCVILPAAR
jgi:signal transduction histidine kinase